MSDKKIIIAIDGYSACGKSTLARAIAKHLGYIYIDTGAMYRAVTLFFLRKGLLIDQQIISNAEKLNLILDQIEISMKINQLDGKTETYLNGELVEKEIRSMEISSWVSKVSELQQVRTKLVSLQQQMGKNKGVVLDGRDIGTKVFPAAEVKLFLTADQMVRARRREKELLDESVDVKLDEILRNITERDRMDTERKESPLVRAADAIVIDNSSLTKREQFDAVLDIIEKVINKDLNA
jgi:CMP/dCMP kinase